MEKRDETELGIVMGSDIFNVLVAVTHKIAQPDIDIFVEYEDNGDFLEGRPLK